MLQTYKTILTQKTFLTEDVLLFRFNLLEPKELTFIAGQYLILPVPQPSGAVINRLYSIASPQQEKQGFDFVIKIIPNGIASIYLTNMKINDEITFQGPAGVFMMKPTQRQKIYLVTGTGFAPAWSMIESGAAGDKEQHLLWGLPYFKDLFFFEKLKKYAEINPHLHITICLSREQNLDMIPEVDRKYFLLGHVTNGLDKFTELQNYDLYLCSGREIIESLRIYSEQKGAIKEQIYFERF